MIPGVPVIIYFILLGERKFEIFEITQRIWKRQENVRKAKKTLCSEENGRVARQP